MYKVRSINLWQYICYYRQEKRTKRFCLKDILDNYYKAKSKPVLQMPSLDAQIKELCKTGYIRQSNIVRDNENDNYLYYDILKIEDYNLLDIPYLR